MIEVKGTAISLPAGDTGMQTFTINGAEQSDGDYAVFTVYSPNTSKQYFTKNIEIVSNTATILFDDQDTQNMRPGKYKWSQRFYTDPVWNSDDTMIIDGTEIHSPFAFWGGNAPTFNVLEAGTNGRN